MLRDNDAEWSSRLGRAMETIKIAVIAPTVEIQFGAGGTVAAVPTVPRDQLVKLLEEDILPTYARLFTERCPQPKMPPALLQLPLSPRLGAHGNARARAVWERVRILCLPC
eukprot:SAG11_NODE_2217_length_3678_cov_5.306510_4_plen_111_part_00